MISGGTAASLRLRARTAGQGYGVVLIARDSERLLRARTELAREFKAEVDILSVDVDDDAACVAAVTTIMQRHGRIDWLITSAGIVEPGMFLDLDLAAHRPRCKRTISARCI